MLPLSVRDRGCFVSETDIAYWSLIVSSIVGIFGVASAVYGARAARLAQLQLTLQEHTASAQGAFEKPSLSCSLLNENCPDKIIIAAKIAKNRVTELSLPFVIKNSGPKTAEHVAIYFRMPKELAYNNQIEIADIKEQWLKIKKAETAILKEEGFSTFILSIPRLAHYERIIFTLPISIRRGTEIVDTVSVTTKDNIPIKVTYKLIFAYQMNVFSACENAKPSSRRYSIEVVDTSQCALREIIDERSRSGREKADAKRRSQSRIQRFKQFSRFLWNGEYKKDWLPKFYVYEPSEQDRVSSTTDPIDRYHTEHALICEGLYDKREDTYFIPAIDTSLFGAPVRRA